MMKLHLFVLVPIFVGILMYLFPSKRISKIAIFIQGIFLIGAILNFIYIRQYGTIIENLGGWKDYIGITLKCDIFSAVLVMLTAFLFLSMKIFSYSSAYSNKLFLFLFMILQGLLNGIFLSNDLFNIYVLVEVATIIVSILIMFKRDSRAIYDGMVYLLVNIVAMTMFVFGIGFIYKTFGVLDFQGIKEQMELISHPQSLIIGYALIITAVGLKSALIPVFSWLPKAHGTPSAPSIVSAILSGLYVKSGVYLFVRIQQVFEGTLDTSKYFLILGFLTGVIGFILALSQSDLKLILAYHTVSQIGLIMMGLNYPSSYAYWGGKYHIINHAFFKSTLFLTAGMIIDEYKTRNIWEIKGVFRRMPIVATATTMAILGITGAPLFNGSISKYLIQSAAAGNIAEYGILLVNLGTIISFMKYASMLYGPWEAKSSSTDIYQGTVVILLGFICLVGGIYGEEFIYLLFQQKVDIDSTAYLEKAFFYFISLGVGAMIYKKVILKTKLLYRVKELELSFNNICISITAFFSMTVLYMTAKYLMGISI
ncbi:multisubunit sodium/proton antiporter, MrpD subunit [Clostridium aceticum]|uniref:Multisubunit sodium/proton antiporter, MrpD subunit n=1 Tax=Clostridium aceticum TaxID=84022 RepID=A0A0D8I9P9_9CLOT|nr:proton-conducting transporter membrane subunit [Clostridium aceticum]AKL96412.1 multisubunit sodium/proton antiporter, MrpD subunit [Clostridium aceticum]KJF26983.1 NADH dehydrogenase [Clostridium aceticum]